jgi:hypothetical protein
MDELVDLDKKTRIEPLEILEQQSIFETHSESPELSRESVTRDSPGEAPFLYVWTF